MKITEYIKNKNHIRLFNLSGDKNNRRSWTK
jgi:hypothetical protein